MAWAVEHTTVLTGDADIPCSLFDIFDGLSVLLTPLAAVNKQHIGSFWTGYRNTLEVIPDIVAGIIDISDLFDNNPENLGVEEYIKKTIKEYGKYYDYFVNKYGEKENDELNI